MAGVDRLKCAQPPRAEKIMSTRARCGCISNIEELQPHSRPRRQKLDAKETLTLDGVRQMIS